MSLFWKRIPAPEEFAKEFEYVEDYLCPKCGMEPVTYYEINKEGFPKYYNDRTFQSDWGDQRTWEEYHICEGTDCQTKFWFEGGN
jgi:hypothetical protein